MRLYYLSLKLISNNTITLCQMNSYIRYLNHKMGQMMAIMETMAKYHQNLCLKHSR